MIYKNTAIRALSLIVALATSFFSYGDEDPASIQHRYMTPSMRVSTNAWLSVSGNVERIVSAATNGLATAADVESKADKATTLAGYGITDAVPLVEDSTGAKTAVTIGNRRSDVTVGPYSIANGFSVAASGYHSHAEGYSTQIGEDDFFAYAWNGDTSYVYSSHGKGTYNINPEGGLDGFYIGEKTLSTIISEGIAGKADKDNVYTKEDVDSRYSALSSQIGDISNIANVLSTTIDQHILDTNNPHKVTAAQVGAYTRDEVDAKIESAVLPTDPTFSNAVLAVGLNIDTNSVAVLNEIAETFGGFPVEGTATTVGGLLAALAAAAAWLRKNKVGSFASVGGASATVENGVAKLDDFFTESNSLLTWTIYARIPYQLNAVTDAPGLLKDRAINTTSLASVTVPDNFTDLLVRASVASSLAVTMPEAIATKYGDTFPGEAGEYLITITKTGAAEAYVRTIKLEVANA